MFTKKVEVSRYYSCDGKEFAYEDVCLQYEKELKQKLEDDIQKQRIQIRNLKIEKNEYRLQFLIDKCDAFNYLYDACNKIGYHKKMAAYYDGKDDYKLVVSDLVDAYENINILYDRAYLWFGTHKHKSRLAKEERRKKSLRWRQENTPDKWRTPNKIRVSKLPKEDNNG